MDVQIHCHICGLFFSVPAYNQHLETVEHQNKSVKYYEMRIASDNLQIFPFFEEDISEFLNDAKNDFEFLVRNLLSKNEKMLINVQLYGLYYDEKFKEENKNIAESMQFDSGQMV